MGLAGAKRSCYCAPGLVLTNACTSSGPSGRLHVTGNSARDLITGYTVGETIRTAVEQAHSLNSTFVGYAHIHSGSYLLSPIAASACMRVRSTSSGCTWWRNNSTAQHSATGHDQPAATSALPSTNMSYCFVRAARIVGSWVGCCCQQPHFQTGCRQDANPASKP